MRIGHLQQIGGTRHYQFSTGRAKGVQAVDFNTGSGFSFTVLPDRGLDIAYCSYKGVNLVYLTPNGISSPAYYDPRGFEWLNSFFGGLLTTCGLTYFGNPGSDEGEELGLHGRYSSIPAERVCDLSRWEENGYVLELTGFVEECSLMGDKLRLCRSITTAIGKKSLLIRDSVENFGYKESPFNILYHINSGFPLLDESSELLLSATHTEPYDDEGRKHLQSTGSFAPPQADFISQDFLHTMAGDDDGYAYAAMINRGLVGGLGLYLRFRMDNLPYLNEWKMLGAKDYVVGIEPVNTKIANRSELRRDGKLPFIGPGERKEMEVEIGILEGIQEIEAFIQKIKSIS